MSTNAESSDARPYLVEIFLVSFAALLLEISYTRVVSFKLFYYYTYLTIGLALLGIGSGAVLVAISKRIRDASTIAVLRWSSIVGAVSVLIGYVVIAALPIDTLAIWTYTARPTLSALARLLLICLMLFASFLPVGVMIATLFARRTEQIGRLYFADLVGAGLACFVVVFILNRAGPPAAIMLAGVMLALVAMRLSAQRTRVAAAAIAVVLAVFVLVPSALPEQRVDATKTFENVDVSFSKWSSLFRVDVVDEKDDVRVLLHDGLVGSAIHRYNGDPKSLTRFDTDERQLPFATPARRPGQVLIIGAAGGNEVLASLYYGAAHIDAVELNPVTYDLVTDRYADFSGRLAENPKVSYVNGEGRSYLARQDKKYDLIWYPAPDSYSANAAAAGAFVLSESYLYTTDAMLESFDHLADGGIIAWHYGEFNADASPNRTARYINTAREALRQIGVTDLTRHILLGSSPTTLGGSMLSTVLVKVTPFTDDEIRNFATALRNVPKSKLLYAPGQIAEPSVLGRLLETPLDQLSTWEDTYPFHVESISDNEPFFWHFHGFGNVVGNYHEAIGSLEFENPAGERVLLLLLGVAVLFAAVFLLAPFVLIRSTWARLPRKLPSALYFASLGFGFIFFEIVLIQRLTLFLGYPTYSLTVTLASILLFTGCGAFISPRLQGRGDVTLLLAGAIVALTIFYQFALEPITDAALIWPLGPRIALVFFLLAPLGLCLGLFMPLGLSAVSKLTDHAGEYVAWGWAINGFASVAGSVLSTVLAMIVGFSGVLYISLALYLVAITTLRVLRA